MKQQDFDHLVHALKTGDETPLDKVFTTNYRYCVGTLISKYQCQEADAQDIYMDALIQFRAQLLKGKVDNQNVKGYIFRIAYNIWLKKQQKEEREGVSSLDVYETESYLAQQDGLYDEEFNPLIRQETIQEMRSEKQDQIEALNWAMNKISPNCKKLLEARLLHGIKPAQLVKQLDYKSTRVVINTISRCKARLIELSKQFLSNLNIAP